MLAVLKAARYSKYVWHANISDFTSFEEQK